MGIIFKKLLSYFKYRINLFIIIVSLTSFLFIFSKILGFFDLVKDFAVLNILYGGGLLFSGIFIILVLPTYPLYFMIWERKNFNIPERLLLMIISNVSFYILVGYFGYFINISLNETYFFAFIGSFSFMLFLIAMLFNSNNQNCSFFKFRNKEIQKSNSVYNYNILKYLKEKGRINIILLIVFIFLLCIFDIIRVSFFMGTDPWYHIFLVEYININKTLPLDFYFENLGLHIFTLIIHYFTNLDIFLIPRFFVFFTFFIGALIIYTLLRRIFKNRNLAIMGVFLIEISFLGFSFLQYQFWPTSLATLQCLTIFYILYRRAESFIRYDPPGNKAFRKDLMLSYILIVILFISSTITHSLVTMSFIVSFTLIYLMYFLKNRKRGGDMILLIILCGIFGAFYLIDFAVGHFSRFLFYYNISNPTFILLLLLGIPCLLIFIRIITKSIDFEIGKYKKIIHNTWYNNLEKKFIIPVIFSVLITTSIVFTIGNILWFNFNISTFLVVIQDGVFVLFSLWGFILFQKKPKGKFLFIWFVNLFLIIGASLLLYLIFGGFSFFGRIFIFSSVPIIIGFISYFYKLIKTHQINKNVVKVSLLLLVIFTIFTSFIEERDYYRTYSIENYELQNIIWMSEYTTKKKVIITEFLWEYLFYYYDFPYNDSDLDPESLHNFITISEGLLLPENHIQNNENIFLVLKSTYNTDVYLILTDYYISFSGLENFGSLSQEQIETYYNLTYFNRICSTRTINNIDEPIYWVV